MKIILSTITLILGILGSAVPSHAQNIEQQWKNGLAGTRLTAYSGSVISSNSTLTTIDFCRNGRYRYSREGSWSVPGQAGGASNSTITGRWDIRQNGVVTMLMYETDRGEKGSFVIYLQASGRVNIGGADYAAQRGGAGC